MKKPITRNIAPDAPLPERMFRCLNCGKYYLGCCEERDAHEVWLESAWEGITRWDEWAAFECMRLHAKGDKSAEIRDGNGREKGTIAVYRDVSA